MRKHCAGCGKVKRLTWPKHIRIFCTKDCAAGLGFAEASAGGGHCSACGEIDCQIDHDEDES